MQILPKKVIYRKEFYDNLLNDYFDHERTIIITTHIMSFVEEVANEIVFLLEGKIYFKGSIQELKSMTEQHDFEHAIASILKDHHA